ncbi:MAG: hypothetical protein V3V17_04015 [Alphaproteobacteria bacterium]
MDAFASSAFLYRKKAERPAGGSPKVVTIMMEVLPMWELWLPLLVVAATGGVMLLLFFAAKKLLIEPQAKDRHEDA